VTNPGSMQPSPTTSPRLVVNISDVIVSRDPTATLVTYALGSCIGVTIYDPVAQVGGMLHFMLPQSSINPARAAELPCMFADTGVPLLFRQAYDLGAKKERLVVCAAGGAEILDTEGHFQIGSRNRTILRKLFWKNSVLLAAEETGGSSSRTLSLCLADGSVSVKSKQQERSLWPA